MLAPDARAVLLDQLRPPLGYRLDAAVATTFTLDLTAALVPPLAFASFELRGTPDPMAALEAVRACADRVDVFHQAGQISIPAQPSDLMAYLEPMVHAAQARPGHLFHPKIWTLRYTADDEPDAYRLLCATRNLTGDRSWDAMLRLDGRRQGGPKATNRPLAELVRALPGLVRTPLDPARRRRIATLAEDLRRIEWDLPEDVRELTFHVFGIAGVRPAADFSGYRHLVVSPFLTDAGLDRVVADSQDVTVVSRVEELDRLSPESAERISSYVLSSLADLDEDHELVDDHHIRTGLHAKLYVAERARLAHVFLGSANATEAAFGGNVEVLVEMVGSPSKLGVGTFLDTDAPFRVLLEEYETTGGALPDPEDTIRRELEDLLRVLAAQQWRVAVQDPDAIGYPVTVSTARQLPIPGRCRVTVELLTVPGRAVRAVGGEEFEATWTGVPLPDVTPFLAVRAGRDRLVVGTVVRADLVGDPAGRLDEVLARQVDSPEKFLRFLALLLGLGNPHLLQMLSGRGTGSGDTWLGDGPGIFELTVRALAEDPDSIDDLDRLVQRLLSTERGRAVLPDGFEQHWTAIAAARAQLTAVAQ